MSKINYSKNISQISQEFNFGIISHSKIKSYLIMGNVANNYSRVTSKLTEIGIKKYQIIDLAHPQITKIGLDDLKKAIKNLWVKPAAIEEIHYLIINGDLLNLISQNRLLKITEEPPNHIRIIIFTVHKKNLIPTLLSRLLIIETADRLQVNHQFNWKKILKKDLVELFKISEKLAKSNHLESIIDSWLLTSCRFEGMTKKKQGICHQLLTAKQLLKTNTNKRLLLDNILINAKDDII